MAWLCVNLDTTELISNNKPFKANKALELLIERNNSYKMYIDKCEGVWANKYSEGYYSVPLFNGVILPSGYINKILGYELTFEMEPVEIK